jgi:hypothetical protein
VGVLSPIYQKMLVDKKINSAFRPEAPSMWMTLERQAKAKEQNAVERAFRVSFDLVFEKAFASFREDGTQLQHPASPPCVAPEDACTSGPLACQ